MRGGRLSEALSGRLLSRRSLSSTPDALLERSSIHPNNMLSGLASYFKERRSGLQRTAGYVGGAYLLGQYALGRLEDVRTTVMQDRSARDK